MKWLFAAAASTLVRVGFRRRSAEDLVRDLGRSRWRLSVTVLASMVAPLAEIGFIVLLYALVEPAQRAALTERLRAVRIASLQAALSTDTGYIALTATAAVMLLSVTIGSKAIYGYLQAEFLFRSFITQSRRILAAYLAATPSRAMTLDRARVANVAVIETGLYGKVVFSLLDALTNIVGAILFAAAATTMAPGLVALALVIAMVTILITHRRLRTPEKTWRPADKGPDVTARPCLGNSQRLPHDQDRGRRAEAARSPVAGSSARGEMAAYQAEQRAVHQTRF